jgi:flagellar motor protein MotB
MAGLLGFLAAFSKKQMQGVGDSLTRAIVAWDPETATDAEIEEMIAELDKITVEAGKAKADFDREQKEADAARKNYDRYISAADILEGQMKTSQTSGDLVKASDIQSSLDKLLDELEQLKPELERETQEAAEAKEFC